MPLPSGDGRPMLTQARLVAMHHPIDRLKQLFEQALHQDPAARPQWLAAACRDEPELQAEVLALLAAHDGAPKRFLATGAPLGELVPQPRPSGPELRLEPGAQLAGYTLLRHLGQGGFGTVWAAQQHTPVQRQVAIKVLHRDPSNAAVAADFARERQALARMQHPNIAQFYDAGTTADGRPFFVMECIAGETVTDHCRRRRLPVAERLQLFVQICRAVQHAHGRGLIHRDLKPGNVLVTEVEGEALAKVIDFGIARAHGTSRSNATTIGGAAAIGTLDYMSPEQAKGVTDLDTRTDVYSLGALLYELLTGCTPHRLSSSTGSSPLERLRVLCETEPVLPSVCVATAPELALAPSLRRQLTRELRGDLDWIVMTALDKERGRRYASVDGLAADVERHLTGDPVLAAPPSALYRLRKLVRRHRAFAIGAAATMVTAGVLGTYAALLLGDNSALAGERDLLRQRSRAVLRTERLLQRAEQLHPPWPSKLPELCQWLDRDWPAVELLRGGLASDLASVASKALPWTDVQQRRDRESHPRYAEWLRQQQFVAALQYATAIRSGTRALQEPPADPEWASINANALNAMAIARVAMEAGARTVPGEAALGLAMARALAARMRGLAGQQFALNTLAFALLANGQDAEARTVMQHACDAAAIGERGQFLQWQEQLHSAIDTAAPNLRDAEAQLAVLAIEIGQRRTFDFHGPNEDVADDLSLDHEAGVRAMQQHEPLQRTVADVQQRRQWAEGLQRLAAAPQFQARWNDARAAIARADGVVASASYRDRPIDLAADHVHGLVPIGMNPVTKLWEFYDLRSAWNGTVAAAELPIPTHAADGSIAVTADTGIVFVLLPGGTVTVGAQATDPQGPNYDAQAEPAEAVAVVELAPFLIARHELTQAQWQRLWTHDATLRSPSRYPAGSNNQIGDRITLAHPAENVDALMCDRLLGWHGMVLPTEEQWEYAARGGTSTPYWCGHASDLAARVNLKDATASRLQSIWGAGESFDDGHLLHAPVDALPANPFGLFGTIGNVVEWTRDSTVQANNTPKDHRSNRGGSFMGVATTARVSYRAKNADTLRTGNMGCRAARLLPP
ncbi:MAG: bifunctional serine/threonine-protein kinase/formylglycine-generating enzyme family protein [Planctomycetes bacterium]|jgi:serine/threonine protein kinase/formylglycine-generating enzyme required for sulfatase activity|nr:bifunctional serine/threonine-protein kinase/formylglycine-generating enzyme family protein [Planctomycetota bacterium]